MFLYHNLFINFGLDVRFRFVLDKLLVINIFCKEIYNKRDVEFDKIEKGIEEKNKFLSRSESVIFKNMTNLKHILKLQQDK